MSDIVERVARAICIDAGPDPDSSRVYPMSGPTWLDYEPEAKAAIAEMFGQECPWKEAILDELADYLLLKDEHESDPKLALRDLIDWEVKKALDEAAEACENLSFFTDVRDLIGMTKQEMSDRTCHEGAKAIRALKSRKGTGDE